MARSWRYRLAARVALVATSLVVAWFSRPTLAPPRVTGFTQLTHDGWPKVFWGQAVPIVLTDGARLYVQENIRGRFVVAQVSAVGGETLPISTPFQNISLNSLSPDKSELIIGSFGSSEEQSFYAIPTLGGAPRRLTDLPGGEVIWMPNGDLLVSHANELIAVNSSGSARSFLKIDPQFWPQSLRWSPDHNVLRFTIGTPIGYYLAEVRANGTGYRRVLQNWNPDENIDSGNWNPDGRIYVFQTLHNWSRANLWAVREKGDFFHRVNHEPVQLTAGPLNFYSPQPSLDGKKIYAIGEQPRSELVSYDIKSHQILPHLDGISARTARFSSDGKWVSYVSYPEGNLWRCRTDGSEKLQLTASQLFVFDPRWSPDGSQIAFVANEPRKPWELFVVSADGGRLRQLPTGNHNLASLSWSPGGKSIHFNDASTFLTVELEKMSVTPAAIPVVSEVNDSVRSPDGKYLAASTPAGDKLLLYDFAKNKWSELAKTNVGFLNWSSDSKCVYFDNGFSPELPVYRVCLSDHRVEEISTLKDFRRLMNPNSTWFSLSPQGDILFVRDTGSQEVYALEIDVP